MVATIIIFVLYGLVSAKGIMIALSMGDLIVIPAYIVTIILCGSGIGLVRMLITKTTGW